jgi:hypothetical protein
MRPIRVRDTPTAVVRALEQRHIFCRVARLDFERPYGHARQVGTLLAAFVVFTKRMEPIPGEASRRNG